MTKENTRSGPISWNRWSLRSFGLSVRDRQIHLSRHISAGFIGSSWFSGLLSLHCLLRIKCFLFEGVSETVWFFFTTGEASDNWISKLSTSLFRNISTVTFVVLLLLGTRSLLYSLSLANNELGIRFLLYFEILCWGFNFPDYFKQLVRWNITHWSWFSPLESRYSFHLSASKRSLILLDSKFA